MDEIHFAPVGRGQFPQLLSIGFFGLHPVQRRQEFDSGTVEIICSLPRCVFS